MKRHILIFLVVFLSFWNYEASAFWGRSDKDSASGLDVAAGFDVNTITTMTGKVLSIPERKGESQHTVMSIVTSQGTVIVVLGPWRYWEEQTITFTKNQDIAVTGSLAQGKDGNLYIFAQRIENRSSGESITLRSETGSPMWSRGNSGPRSGGMQNSGRSSGAGSGSGAGNRGGNMRGGGRR